jgi:hypothetical protein
MKLLMFRNRIPAESRVQRFDVWRSYNLGLCPRLEMIGVFDAKHLGASDSFYADKAFAPAIFRVG